LFKAFFIVNLLLNLYGIIFVPLLRREIEKSSASKSPNNCQCNPNPRNEHIQKSTPIRHIGCVCKLTPCRCRKDRSYTNYKRPLAKCYYCKSLPCT